MADDIISMDRQDLKKYALEVLTHYIQVTP